MKSCGQAIEQMKILLRIVIIGAILIWLVFDLTLTYKGILNWQDEILEEMADRIKTGMTQEEVRKIMGPPRYEITVDPGLF